MASGGTIQSVLGKISKDHLECSICCNRFKQPKLLDCLHSFCQQCLQELRESHDPNSDKLPCPLCRQETTLNDKKVTDLPNNFSLSALVEEIEIQQQILEGPKSGMACQKCDQKQAVSRCMDCDFFLCQECQTVHEGWAALKSHKIYTLAQLQSGEIAYKSKLREQVPKCDKHSDQNLSVYCNTCEHMICLMCVVLDHGKHSIIDLPKALDKCKQHVAKLLAKAEKSKTSLNIAMDETEEYRKKVDSVFAESNKKISIKADKEVVRIREEEKKLKEDIVKIYQDIVKTTDNAQSANSKESVKAQQKLDEVTQLMAEASCYEILDLKKKLEHNLSELTEKHPEKVPDRLSLMEFEEAKGSLIGRLVMRSDPKMKPKDGKWELKTTLQSVGTHPPTNFSCAYDVASFSNNEIIVADIHIKQLLTCSLMSSQLSSSLMSQGLNNPRYVSVNKDDQLIVLDGQEVKIFNRGYQLLSQFKPGEKSKSTPSCIAVDDNNLIAVGYEGKNEISLHNQDGSLNKILPTTIIGDFMTTFKQHYIYINYSSRMLLSVDYNGSTVFSVDLSKYVNGHPYGVCCDTDGSIYVGVLDGGGSIHHFSPDGKYIECVIKGCGDLCGMTITPDDHIVTASRTCVKIYHRV